jgi:site-specific DNA recombinase
MSGRVAIYARVSTPNQAQAQTIEQQLERLQAYVQSQGWQLQEDHVFRDDGYSGATLRRPGLDRLRDVARFQEVDLILVIAPDRLARNYVHQMVLLDELEGHGCQVEFLDRPMSQDPHDQLLLQIRSAVAEYERTLITERMRRGRLAKYRAGVLLPWTRPPYGYRLDPDTPRDPAGVRIEEGEGAVVREIYALYLQGGYSLCQLAKYLQHQGIPTPNGKKIWSLSTLRAILTQLAYTGTVYACRYRYRPPRIRRSATHPIGQPHGTAVALLPEDWIFVARVPSIVTEEEFSGAQTRLAQNQSFARRNNKAHQYLLRALVSCGLCLSSCSCRALNRGKHRYYVCTGKAKAIHSRKEEKCPSRFVPAQQLDELVWQDLCAILTHPEHITQALKRAHGGHWLPQELQARRDSLRRGHASLEQQLDRLTQAYLSGVIPLAEYQRRRGDLERKMKALAQQEEQLALHSQQREVISGLTTKVEDFCERVQTGLKDANFEQRRQLVELLIDRVIVTEEDVEIRYVIPTAPQSELVRFCQLRSDYRHHLPAHGPGLSVPGSHHGLAPTGRGWRGGYPTPWRWASVWRPWKEP